MEEQTTVGNYIRLEYLGKGAFSKVYLGQHLETGDRVALKIMDRSEKAEEIMGPYIKNEIDIMKELEHLNFIRLKDYELKGTVTKPCGSQKNCFWLALELGSQGELFDLVALTGQFSERICKYYFLQIINALEYMHSKGIYHRDIKPENILLDDEFNLKIADFGFATTKSFCKDRAGTEGYMSPELLDNEKYSSPVADIFAFANVLFIMYARRPAFQRANIDDKLYKCIALNRLDKFWKEHSHFCDENGQTISFSSEFMSLISSMLQFDPVTRLTLPEIKAHPWL